MASNRGPDSNGKGSNADKVQDSDTSCLGLVLELLATTACTSYSNSLSESVQFLESQLQAERHRLAVLPQEAEGLRKSLEHAETYFWCNNKRWRILAPNRTKLISLLSFLPAWWIPCFLSSFEVVSVMLLFCCHVYLHWWPILRASVCNMLLCSLYFHWWQSLCNAQDAAISPMCQGTT